MFSPFSRTGYIFFSNNVTYPSDVFVDSSGKIYMVYESGVDFVVRIQEAGVIVRTLPPGGVSSSSCNLTEIYNAYGVAVDQSGNIYVSQYSCYMVVKWTPNATKGTLVAGQPGISGSTSTTLSYVRYIHLDEDRSALYVSDTGNNRIQKFIIGGNGTGITVAGGAGAGANLNQLKSPAGIRVTSDGQTFYIADYGNNRIMKWVIGASQGVVVAGSASGVAGSTSQLLNGPGGLALDPTETYLYVADNGNHRVQRFRVQ
jgi:sugar lactone lactonase YvrE